MCRPTAGFGRDVACMRGVSARPGFETLCRKPILLLRLCFGNFRQRPFKFRATATLGASVKIFFRHQRGDFLRLSSIALAFKPVFLPTGRLPASSYSITSGTDRKAETKTLASTTIWGALMGGIAFEPGHLSIGNSTTGALTAVIQALARSGTRRASRLHSRARPFVSPQQSQQV